LLYVPFYSFRSEPAPETDQLWRIPASSKGRGNRAAGWFADYIADQGDENMKSLALAEGVKGWATAGDEYVQWMMEYDAKVWLQSRLLLEAMLHRRGGSMRIICES
jgi:hypothetical protein